MGGWIALHVPLGTFFDAVGFRWMYSRLPFGQDHLAYGDGGWSSYCFELVRNRANTKFKNLRISGKCCLRSRSSIGRC